MSFSIHYVYENAEAWTMEWSHGGDRGKMGWIVRSMRSDETNRLYAGGLEYQVSFR